MSEMTNTHAKRWANNGYDLSEISAEQGGIIKRVIDFNFLNPRFIRFEKGDVTARDYFVANEASVVVVFDDGSTLENPPIYLGFAEM